MTRQWLRLACAAYGAVAILIYGLIKLSCGMGPGGSATCDSAADQNATWFAIAAFLVFLIATWFTRPREG
jgi:hypothetical protein